MQHMSLFFVVVVFFTRDGSKSMDVWHQTELSILLSHEDISINPCADFGWWRWLKDVGHQPNRLFWQLSHKLFPLKVCLLKLFNPVISGFHILFPLWVGNTTQFHTDWQDYILIYCMSLSKVLIELVWCLHWVKLKTKTLWLHLFIKWVFDFLAWFYTDSPKKTQLFWQLWDPHKIIQFNGILFVC